MTVLTELQRINSGLYGEKITSNDVDNLRKKISSELLPEWLIEILQNYNLSGVCFSLDEKFDESGVGAELKWFSPTQIIDESLFSYPGKVVSDLGYLPIAACLSGSGDPYFLRIKDSNFDDPALVRILHDLVASDDFYPESEVEIVCNSLSQFFRCSCIA